MTAGAELVEPDWVADFEHGNETGAHIGVCERDCPFVTGGAAGPCAGEAVSLLFGGDSGQVQVEHAAALLNGVAVFVCEHDADRAGAKFVGEFGEQSVLAVVVHNEVTETAVERNELLDVVV